MIVRRLTSRLAKGANKSRSSDPVTTRTGRSLPLTIAGYDQDRGSISNRHFRSVCYAPFLSMDFGPMGSISLCNHSHTEVAQVSDEISVLEVWRGASYGRYRDEMRQYILDDDNCLHCIRQCEAGPSSHVFAVEQFDHWAHDDPQPLFPKRLIFRLNNTCNLACVMCDGDTSSRIRKERDRLPIAPSAYGERFFQDMELILPHVEHVEFYGGEPFLVREHGRIFDIMEKVQATCSIYINTNAVSLTAKARERLETLNFTTIAISMDAVSSEVHEKVRLGLRSDVFFRNVDYLLALRQQRNLCVMLNVTEHRKNWFELPNVFRFAEERQLPLHINTCIHPHNVTLYTLPEAQLAYVLDFLERQRVSLIRDFNRPMNLGSYDFLLSLIQSELSRRGPGWQPILENFNAESDGLLATPLAGNRPFDSPKRVAEEADRIVEHLDSRTAARMLLEMIQRVNSLPDAENWASTANHFADLSDRLG